MISNYRLLFCLIILGLTIVIQSARAQQGVGIGTDYPNDKAALDIQSPSNNKGLLIPRLTSSQRNNINPGATEDGLMVYDTEEKNFFYYNAGYDEWQELNPLPQGAIVMWSGTTAPSGWAICDGTNGTPDLRGRFIVASGQNASPVSGDNNPNYTVNQTGGLNQVKLTAAQSGLPSHHHSINHTHSITDPGHTHDVDHHGYEDVGDANKQASYNRNTGQKIDTESATTGITINTFSGNSGDVSSASASSAHENRPSYYVLAFIMKL